MSYPNPPQPPHDPYAAPAPQPPGSPVAPSAYGQPAPYDQPVAAAPYGQAPYGQQAGYGQAPYQYPPLPGYAPRRTSGLAIGSLVASCAGILTLGLGGIVGLVLGLVALRQISRDGRAGRGLAVAGIAVGAVMSLYLLAWLGLFVVGLSFDTSTDYSTTL